MDRAVISERRFFNMENVYRELSFKVKESPAFLMRMRRGPRYDQKKVWHSFRGPVCRCCFRDYYLSSFDAASEENRSKIESGNFSDLRCSACEATGRRSARRFESDAVCRFLKEIFGHEEKRRFKEWLKENYSMYLVLDGDESYDVEMNNFDWFLGKYGRFETLCASIDHGVEPNTRLYPLYKAIEIKSGWNKVSVEKRSAV